MNAKELFETQSMAVHHTRQRYLDLIGHIVGMANNDGFIVTVEVKGSPEGMGQGRIAVDVRDGRPIYQHLGQLAAAAREEAELEKAKQSLDRNEAS